MLRRAWKPLAATSVLIGPGYYWYTLKYRQEAFELAVKVRQSDGKTVMTTRSIPLLPVESIEARIHERATSESIPRPGGIVWKHSTASLAANDPIEDASSHQIVTRDTNDPSAPGDLLFWTIMDGHGGHHTSQLLSRVLINAVALELSNLIQNPTKPGGLINNIRSSLFPSAAQPSAGDPETVATTIQNAFTNLDKELLNAPVQLLANNLDESALKSKAIPDLSQHPMALATMLPAVSGSCALMAMFDTAHRDLYVACTGDSRAVAGVWEESPDGKGTWRVEVLSEDQTGRNLNEVRRIQSEHPADEAHSVIKAGRVLGGLEPTRAFGDARYKWTREAQHILNQAFLVGNNQNIRLPPSTFKTPPYVTSTPVVTHRKLSFLPLPESPASKPASALRFIVLATDGLWDQLSSQEVVALVGGHLAGLKGNVSKDSLPALVPTSTGAPTVEGKDKKRPKKEDGEWAFVDENVSAHLIRNAFGGGDVVSLRKLLSIPAPFARSYRDDVTVTVVWWEDGREGDAKVETIAPKAKL
ncbi:hypothetical protein HWV62_32228 [Athelia sp. TMB]|nr:hypothetical protein HWV62_32228 [Athelia sp. TMB]